MTCNQLLVSRPCHNPFTNRGLIHTTKQSKTPAPSPDLHQSQGFSSHLQLCVVRLPRRVIPLLDTPIPAGHAQPKQKRHPGQMSFPVPNRVLEIGAAGVEPGPVVVSGLVRVWEEAPKVHRERHRQLTTGFGGRTEELRRGGELDADSGIERSRGLDEAEHALPH